MSEVMRLLIGYDGSAFADAAIDDLRRAGLPQQVQALVLSVADVFLPPEGSPETAELPPWLAETIAQAHREATQAVEAARGLALQGCSRIQSHFPGWQVHAEARADSLAWGIIARAGELKTDLVVVGSHGRSALGRFVLGSVSQQVVNDAPCSVRVGRRHLKDDNSPARVVVGVDGSPNADAAVEAVAARRWPAGSAVRVVAAFDPRMSTAVGPMHASVLRWVEAHEGDGQAWVYRMTEAAAEQVRATGVIAAPVVLEGDPRQVLVAEAEQWGADCIFVGAQGLSGLQGFLLGSVSAAVAARAHCSVEIVRPRQAA